MSSLVSVAINLMTRLISVIHFISYLRQEQLSLNDISYDALRDGRIMWGSPPKWLNSSPAERHVKEDKSIYSIDTGASHVMECGWRG